MAAGTKWSLHHVHADPRIRRRQSAACRSFVLACASSCGSTVDPIALAVACPSAVRAVIATSGRMAFGSACGDASATSGPAPSNAGTVALVRAAGSVAVACTLAVDRTGPRGGLTVGTGACRGCSIRAADLRTRTGSRDGSVRAYAVAFERPRRCCICAGSLAGVVGAAAGGAWSEVRGV